MFMREVLRGGRMPLLETVIENGVVGRQDNHEVEPPACSFQQRSRSQGMSCTVS